MVSEVALHGQLAFLLLGLWRGTVSWWGVHYKTMLITSWQQEAKRAEGAENLGS
jgi:hypothetical protein